MADLSKETVKYTRLWGLHRSCKIFHLSYLKKSFSKRPKEVEVVEIVGQSGRRHAICSEIEKRVYVNTPSTKAPTASLHSVHWHMVKRYRLVCYDLL
ncbi:Hypothetical predicted protein [Paramuricea clavata]|uniref:Uncharacterized protein n=1 Tax=Paramuricea clavata TaxID=317549 RepID=A0A6S7FHF6_PARCT|nr:Hypothetical predicted protein [Paramuricea clavata]